MPGRTGGRATFCFHYLARNPGEVVVVVVAVLLSSSPLLWWLSSLWSFVVLVVVVVVVVRAPVWVAGAVIDTFVEVLTVGMRVDVLIVTSNVAVDLLMDALTVIRLGLLANNIGVDVLVDVNVNVYAGVMTAFEFPMPGRPLEEFRC